MNEKKDIDCNININKPNLYFNNIVEEEIHVLVVTYMDDTSYIIYTKEDMKDQLFLADSYYNLNNILVNKTKLVILMNKNKKKTQDQKKSWQSIHYFTISRNQ